ncbi:hypothetical protein HPB51_003246 [Rhipicephalus microplus]|uniref:THAP-type domain-containing protein n=1 Tax=Rhipicephalus microplus TaxID=6941 RepID=A0A9J6EEW3_RHIMP|nr:hypothetical protein HPB51_003246 [Rhipicephalus microplus]
MCCVPQCTNRAVKEEISLHSFPLDVRLKKEWVVKLRIGKPVTPPMKFCSAHFVTEDFLWSSIGTHTAKLLVDVSPAGLITFVSCSFGGRASDRTCVEKSGVLEKLDCFEDDVMIDKGSNLGSLCENLGVGVVQPPFLRGQLQFMAKDSEKTLKIARAPVHVERAIQTIKFFKVLKEPVPWEVVGALDEIFIVIGGVVNLSSPIFSEKRFE